MLSNIFMPKFKTAAIMLLIPILSLSGCTCINFSKEKDPYIQQAHPLKNKNLALVLGGGGAKGFAHVGVLEELENAGIIPDVIIGCSAGAIVGALYAANPDIETLKKLVLAGRRSEVIAMSTADWPYSIYSQKKLAAYLLANVKQHQFKDLKIPLIVTATNLQFGNLTSFSDGDIIDPILASAAFPGAFAPVQMHGQYYVDCGVADPVPVRVAKELGFKTIVAVNIAEQLPDTAPNHIFGLMKRSMEIAYANQSKYASEGADVIIDFKFKNIGVFTDEYNDYLYQEGRMAAKKAVPKILEKLN